MHRQVWGKGRWWGRLYRRAMMSGAMCRVFQFVSGLQRRQMDIVCEQWADEGETDLAEWFSE